MRTLVSALEGAKKALLLGIGGGGDIVGTIPTSGLLRSFGVDYVMGGLSWERAAVDSVPGPRRFEETRGARKLNDVVWFAKGDTVTATGVRFAESGVAEFYGRETLLIDINHGVEGVVEGLLHAAGQLEADLILGIDVGGDAIAFGDEPGLVSPLADSIMTASLAKLEPQVPTIMGVFGFGSDGELTQEELERSLRTIAGEGGLMGSWGITHEILHEMERVTEIVPTEASRLPVDYLRGALGREATIRGGRRNVILSVASTVTFYLSPRVVFDRVSRTARAVAECRSLEEANSILHGLGIRTELDLEYELLA